MALTSDRTFASNNNQRSEREMRERVWEMIKDIRICSMITQRADGQLCARPMAARQEDYKGTLWFFTRDTSSKVQQIQSHEDVLLAYADPQTHEFVNINGTADILRDRNRINALWTETMRSWFPNGPTDPSIALIRVIPESAEYWDNRAGSFIQAYGFNTGDVVGNTFAYQAAARLGQHGTVRM